MTQPGDLVLVWSYSQNRNCCAIYLGEAEFSPERFLRHWVYSPELLMREQLGSHITSPKIKVRQIKHIVQSIQECV